MKTLNEAWTKPSYDDTSKAFWYVHYGMSASYSIKGVVETMKFVKNHPNAVVWTSANLDIEPMKASDWRLWFRKCLAAKINRNEPVRGRKDSEDWFMKAFMVSRELNKRNVHLHEVPKELLRRLMHRLYTHSPCEFCSWLNCTVCEVNR